MAGTAYKYDALTDCATGARRKRPYCSFDVFMMGCADAQSFFSQPEVGSLHSSSVILNKFLGKSSL